MIAGSVVLLHAAGLWALQSGLMRQAAEIIIPAEVLSEFLTPAPPAAPPAPPVPLPHKPTPAPPKPTPPKPRPAPTPAPAPMPLAIADPTPAPAAPVGVVQQQPAAAPVEAAPAPAPAAPAAPPGPAIIQPSSDASHLNNPKPVYPAVSKRLGEQGKIVLRVLIGTDGLPQKIEIKQSSGYERLDRQAVDTVSRWRFVPGTRNGVPEAMWYLQPINFVLQQ
ncbi:TonB family protein [Alicycliphilus denitrificans K601]|uniref:TonB family protein n=1 Tax=Alicycliphilus denitrificans (strain DSM 14773 / CIP 107495 / K601) TaxID=596154 RepID=F4G440_ALIDK|nr:TonB family protein [Alicycliphilus denitrificans K601]